MNRAAWLLATVFSIFIVKPGPLERPVVKWQYNNPYVVYSEVNFDARELEFYSAHRHDLEFHQAYTAPVKHNKNIYNMSRKQLNALSVREKAKLVGLSVSEFKTMTSVINHEAGTKMDDKILVAAVIWNRKKCKQFNNSIKGVITEPGQFYDISKDRSGSSKDKKAQLAILLAYKQINQGKIPHNVLYFNSISFGTKNPRRYQKYRYVNNYFIKDSQCKCSWCKNRNRKL